MCWRDRRVFVLERFMLVCIREEGENSVGEGMISICWRDEGQYVLEE